MKIFVSWSGNRSKAVAELFCRWLRMTIQAVEPWMSSTDLDRGSVWFSEIAGQLAETNMGIICLTSENKDRPWILFESGALAKGLNDSRVCTFLIDLSPTDIIDPLAQFNHTLPNKAGVLSLVETINKSLGEKALPAETLSGVFEKFWPDFDSQFSKILKQHPAAAKVEERSDESLLSEVLMTVRGLEKAIASNDRAKQPTESTQSLMGLNELRYIGDVNGSDLSFGDRAHHEIVNGIIEQAENGAPSQLLSRWLRSALLAEGVRIPILLAMKWTHNAAEIATSGKEFDFDLFPT